MTEYKYLFGSKRLKLNNARDEDWLTYVDISPKELRAIKSPDEIRAFVSIPFTKTLINHFNQECKAHPDPFKALYLYQVSAGFFTEDTEYVFKEFNILEHKAAWIAWLKAYMNSDRAKNQAEKYEGKLSKIFYHILYQYYMIKENTHWISEEAKAEVQKIHDLEVPSSYFYELRDLINSL